MHVCRPRRVCPAHNAFQLSKALQQIFPSISRNRTTSARRHNTNPNSSPDGVVTRLRPRGLTQEIIAVNVRQSEDIRPDDLGATLEAHRASNAIYAQELAQSEPRLPFSQSSAATDKDFEAYSQKVKQSHTSASAQQTPTWQAKITSQWESRSVHWRVDFPKDLEDHRYAREYTNEQRAFRRRKFIDLAIDIFKDICVQEREQQNYEGVVHDSQKFLDSAVRLVGSTNYHLSESERRTSWRHAVDLARKKLRALSNKPGQPIDALVERDAQQVHQNNTNLQVFAANKGLGPMLSPRQIRGLWNLYKESQIVGELQAPVANVLSREDGSIKNLTTGEKRLLQMKDKDASEIREYEGRPVEPITESAIAANKQPWFVPMLREPGKRGYGMDPIGRLDLEIKGLHAFLLPNRAQAAARNKAIEDTIRLINGTLKYTGMELFGSVRTGLATACSDVDIRVFPLKRDTGWDPEKASRFDLRTVMSKRLEHFLHPVLVKRKDYILVQFRQARYPLVTVQHRETGLDFQIVAANDSSLSREYVKKYLETYPGIHELYNVVKTLFDVRGFLDVFRGGLASYTVFIMVASVYRMTKDAPTNSPAQNLLAFLSFWMKFDTYKHGLSLEPPLIFPKHQPTSSTPKKGQTRPKDMPDDVALEKGLEAIRVADRAQPYLLCLQDPADPFNDLGSKTFAIKHVQETLASIHDKLILQLSLNDPEGSLLEPVVGPVFTKNYPHHQQLEEYGEQVLANAEPAEPEESHADVLPESDEKALGERASS